MPTVIEIENIVYWVIERLDFPVAVLTLGAVAAISQIIGRFGIVRGTFIAFIAVTAVCLGLHDQLSKIYNLFSPHTAQAKTDDSVKSLHILHSIDWKGILHGLSRLITEDGTARKDSPHSSDSDRDADPTPVVVNPSPPAMEWEVVTQPEIGVPYIQAKVFGQYRPVKQVPAGTAGADLVILRLDQFGGYYAVGGNVPRFASPVFGGGFNPGFHGGGMMPHMRHHGR